MRILKCSAVVVPAAPLEPAPLTLVQIKEKEPVKSAVVCFEIKEPQA